MSLASFFQAYRSPRTLTPAALIVLFGAGCQLGFDEPERLVAPRIAARPDVPTGNLVGGTTSITDGGRIIASLYVPATLDLNAQIPLLVALHGANGTAESQISAFSTYADQYGFALLAPKSQSFTWDAIHQWYGPDVSNLEFALSYVFTRARVDPARIFLEGFSDGASYGLSLGLTNGDLFRNIVAFSPGMLLGVDPVSRPAVFISHGLDDPILPVQTTARPIVAQLQAAGYPVVYQEFAGGHSVPKSIADMAFAWLFN